MRRFSRWMPPAPRHQMTCAGWLFLLGLAGAAVAMGIGWPVVVGVPLSIVVVCGLLLVIVFTMIAGNFGNRYLRRLAAQREGEDIGTFARAFNRRTEPFDPWVVRATWDALQPYVVFPEGRVPLRPTDRLFEDLCIDPDDLDLGLVQEVADRAGYLLDNLEANPLYGHVRTVGDLVRCITRQPQGKGGTP